MSLPKESLVINKGENLITPYIRSCYKTSAFCDLVLIASGNEKISCHKLVMCSLSQRLLRFCTDSGEIDDSTSIFLPQFSYQELRHFVDIITKR